jgi:HD-GYP domain-containing protein (c-di-GMP phosphodiesterase class II)
VRLHPYFTERMLQESPSLAPIGALASEVRERLDGSGYPRGLTGAALTPPSRVLAAADVYQSMVEPRAHRPRLSVEDAERELRMEVRSGRLDGAAVDAVLGAAGHRRSAQRQWPAGLTPREVEVLTLVARGRSSKEIAAELSVSPKTARNHTEHVYTKIGATSRVEACLFASKHGLLVDSAS